MRPAETHSRLLICCSGGKPGQTSPVDGPVVSVVVIHLTYFDARRLAAGETRERSERPEGLLEHMASDGQKVAREE